MGAYPLVNGSLVSCYVRSYTNPNTQNTLGYTNHKMQKLDRYWLSTWVRTRSERLSLLGELHILDLGTKVAFYMI